MTRTFVTSFLHGHRTALIRLFNTNRNIHLGFGFFFNPHYFLSFFVFRDKNLCHDEFSFFFLISPSQKKRRGISMSKTIHVLKIEENTVLRLLIPANVGKKVRFECSAKFSLVGAKV